MNDRIDNVAMIANDQTGNEFDLNHKQLDAFLGKFAELIIRECASIADDGYGSAHFGNGIAGYQLLQHFGIEE